MVSPMVLDPAGGSLLTITGTNFGLSPTVIVGGFCTLVDVSTYSNHF